MESGPFLILPTIRGAYLLRSRKFRRVQDVTPRYLEQIFQKLSAWRVFVKSIRGPKGGYYLARKPEMIAVSEVLRAMDDSLEPVFCVRPSKGRKKCRRESKCVAQVILAGSRKTPR